MNINLSIVIKINKKLSFCKFICFLELLFFVYCICEKYAFSYRSKNKKNQIIQWHEARRPCEKNWQNKINGLLF